MSEYSTTKRQRYEILRTALLKERSSFETHWSELAQFIRPRRMRISTGDKNKGDKRNQRIIDSTATFAARTLQSGLHAGITSPARPWMKLTVADPEVADMAAVKKWLHLVTKRMLTVFLRSNIYNQLPVLYGDLGVFGTGAMAILDEKDLIRAYSYPIGSYALGVSARGVVDIFVRDTQMTVRQVVETFGVIPGTRSIDWSKISASTKNAWDNANYENTLDVSWIVCPNIDADPNKLDAKYLPYSSCHFEKGQEKEDTFLRESGFNEFPILAPRWDVVDDSYGVDCPGMVALGDIKGLQLMTKKKAQAVELITTPPMQGPTSAKNQKISLLPGDVTHVEDTSLGKGIRPIYELRIDLSHVREDIQDSRRLIQRAFYEDLFLMLAQSEVRDVTAREIDERHEEKLLALGPVLERMNDELLDPLIDRVFAQMGRAGQIPEPPEELLHQPLRVEYTSLMAQAQKMVGVASLDRFFQATVPLIETFPAIRHKINVFKAVNDYGEMLGVDPSIIVPDDEAEEAMQAEQQQIAEQRQIEQQAIAAKSTRDLANSPAGGDTALAELQEQGA